MEKSIQNFLEFNGKAIYFLAKDGTYWIALRPICQALGINWNRQFQELKTDPILKDAFALEQMRDTKNRIASMVSLPEFYVYGWLFDIKSNNEQLKLYKWKCYEVLYNFFHGTITQRTKLLRQNYDESLRIAELERQLLIEDPDPRYVELVALEKNRKHRFRSLSSLDKSLINGQQKLF